MASRKRKRRPPERFSEEKQTKMTWNMLDMAAVCMSDESATIPSSGPSNTRSGLNSSKRNKKNALDRRNLELNLENNYPEQYVSQLGVFHISLCTNREQESEVRLNGPGCNGLKLTSDSDNPQEWTNGKYSCITVRLSFESRCSEPMATTKNMNLADEQNKSPDVDSLTQVAFKAVVPSVSEERLEALAYLQSKGVISLVLKPEQHILKDWWEVVVCLNESGLTKLPFASMDTRKRKIDEMMKVLVGWFCELSAENDLVINECNVLGEIGGFDELYDAVKQARERDCGTGEAALHISKLQENPCQYNSHPRCKYDTNGKRTCDCRVLNTKFDNVLNGVIINDVQHPKLKPVLRGYQKKAVNWMLRREQSCQLHCLENHLNASLDAIHPLWQEVNTMDGKQIYFNPYTGRLTKERFPLPNLPLGGILADEMGLGKTVEVIACILCHPKPSGPNPLDNKRTSSYNSSINQGNPSSSSVHGGPNNVSTHCEIYSTGGANMSVVKPDHRDLDDKERIDDLFSPIDVGKELAPTEHRCLNTKPLEGKSDCPVGFKISGSETGENPNERSCDLPGNCNRSESESSTTTHTKHDVVKAVSEEISCSVHEQRLKKDETIPNYGFYKPHCESTNVSFGQHSISLMTSSNLQEGSAFKNLGKTVEEGVESGCVHDKTVGLNQESDISNCVNVPIPHNSCNEGNVKTKDTEDLRLDKSKELAATQKSAIVDSSSPSGASVKHSAIIKCQCICGVTSASYDDALLQCCGCEAVFHAACLQYHCPQEFICPHCALKQSAVPSRATLIISPAPIAQQWVDEIFRHTEPSSIKLLVYEGVAKSGFILPEVLADHDVILTTYSTLRSDFYHLGTKQGNVEGRARRYDRRYVAVPSPLTGILFWRICLDEAQMVESTTAKAAEVALHLNSVHRWCVTGTPIQKGLEDIYGLLLFLGIDPYCYHKWWKALLYEPYKNGQRQALYNLLAKVMWRSAKKDVIHEIQLPDQEEKVKWLMFTPVEQHFYRRQHEECAGTAMKMLSHWEKTDTMLSAIDRHTVHQLLNPLLRLRQACCHPQAVRGGYLSVQKSTLTMDKLLESLISKAKLECEEAHRQLLFAFNGLAGVHILKEEWPQAVDMYREAMRSWTEHEATFRTDALQKLHTLFNLSEVLHQHQSGSSRTLNDDKLQDQVKDLKNSYMQRANTQVTAAQQNLDVAKSTLAEIKQKVDLHSPWWVEALQNTATKGMEGDLCQRIKDELSSTATELGSIGRFTDLRGLQYLVSSKLDLIESTYNNLLVSLESLVVPPTPQMVQASAECCLRPADDSRASRCAFCQVDDIFTEYESRIFGHQGMKGVDDNNLQTDESLDWHRHGNTGGLRAESEVEKVLRVVHNFIKTNKIAPAVQQEGRHHLNLIEGLRKEFKFLRALWFALHERVSSLDELDMCTTRLRLQLPGEPATDNIHVIHPLQVEQQRLKFMSDRLVAQTELRKKLGQLLYLNNLAKTQTYHDGKNPELCPVCVKQLGVQWSVFSCGHCICCQCAWVLLRQAGVGPRHRNVHVKCPMCRIPTIAQEISYVSTARTQTEESRENISVKGSHSTKVEAVVRTLLAIKSADNTAKCLVFSTWQDVLVVIAKALDENGVKYRHITGSKHFQTNLKTFKQDAMVAVLLLPLQTGSNGLNIIEATHVLLVEPALNPAHELQAVGRVHRIGQTKPTHVYRFIIRGTVEARMYSLLQSKPTGSVRPGARDSENSNLTLGDLASLFTQDDEQDEEQCMTGSYNFVDQSGPSTELQ